MSIFIASKGLQYLERVNVKSLIVERIVSSLEFRAKSGRSWRLAYSSSGFALLFYYIGI